MVGGSPNNELDLDADGYVECSPWTGTDGAIVDGGDCDNGDDEESPGNTVEVCDNKDNDCDGKTDEVEQNKDGKGLVYVGIDGKVGGRERHLSAGAHNVCEESGRERERERDPNGGGGNVSDRFAF